MYWHFFLGESGLESEPYKTDLEYLEDNFEVKIPVFYSNFKTFASPPLSLSSPPLSLLPLLLFFSLSLSYSLSPSHQLIESLVKARKTENSDEIIFSRPDQRRPEAVIREMKAKARSLTAKINGRMEATKQNGG